MVSPRILVLGGAGMLGHKLAQRLRASFPVAATFRDAYPPSSAPARFALNGVEAITGIDVTSEAALDDVFARAKPDVVLNAVGVVKQLKASKDPLPSIAINALLPHRIAARCRLETRPVRLIHFSTDCVFSGRKGPYQESDVADADDLYGRSKLLGEVVGPGALTLRSSIIGRELSRHTGLVEWFLAQRGRVGGYSGALYTGVTTSVMADLVARLIIEQPQLEGVWQVAAAPIDKYALLQIIHRAYGLNTTIDRDTEFFCDRRLDGARFAAATGFQAPDWETMIAEMRADPTPYETAKA